MLPCRWFDWDLKRAEKLSLGLRPSERVLEPLEDVGQQLALTFNNDGSLLAVGGEVGISPYTISGWNESIVAPCHWRKIVQCEDTTLLFIVNVTFKKASYVRFGSPLILVEVWQSVL